MKKYNFNAGPSILPREVIENTAKQILDFNGTGLSLAEISHRSKDFQPVVDEAESLIKEILNIPEGYSVLFLGGGASLVLYGAFQLPYKEGRISQHRHMGKEGHEGGKALWRCG